MEKDILIYDAGKYVCNIVITIDQPNAISQFLEVEIDGKLVPVYVFLDMDYGIIIPEVVRDKLNETLNGKE